MYLTLNQARLPFRHADMVCEEATAPLWNAPKGKRFTFGTFATPVIHTTGASTEFAPLAGNLQVGNISAACQPSLRFRALCFPRGLLRLATFFQH